MIPYPSKVEFKACKFTINSETRISFSPELTYVTDYLIDLINNSTGFSLAVNLEANKKNTISLVLHDTSKILTSEGYQLSINLDNIIIEAKTHQGIFYGIQTLRQLLPIEIESREVIKEFIWTVPCMSIVDNPRFRWRGLMFDVGRHFHDVATIKRTLDLLALMKMNVFHWHLTEDQGWRIEIKKYPKLRGYKFNPIQEKITILNIEVLEEGFKEKEKIDPKILLKRGLIRKIKGKVPRVKILGKGEVKKSFIIEDPNQACDILEEALNIAFNGRPGL